MLGMAKKERIEDQEILCRIFGDLKFETKFCN
jgi:hypothetical protein